MMTFMPSSTASMRLIAAPSPLLAAVTSATFAFVVILRRADLEHRSRQRIVKNVPCIIFRVAIDRLCIHKAIVTVPDDPEPRSLPPPRVDLHGGGRASAA